MKRFFQYLVYLLAKGVMLLMEHTPRRCFYVLSSAAGWIASLIPAFGGLVRTNLRCAFPEKSEPEIRRMARKSLESLCLTVCEFFWFHNKPEKAHELIDIQPDLQGIMDELKQNGDKRPIIFITPHFGNWELSGMVLALVFGYKMATVVRSARNPYLDRLISGGRTVKNVQIIHSRGGMLKLVHAMENGCAAGMLIDQNTKIRNGGVFVNFFGIPCPVSRFPATMALKKNAYIGVGSCIRKPDGRFHATMRKLPKEISEYNSEEEITQDIMAISEDLIRMAPEQYLWLYKRFQYIPPDAPDLIRAKFPAYAYVPSERFFDHAARARAKRHGKEEE